jgi:hypothetical protein
MSQDEQVLADLCDLAAKIDEEADYVRYHVEAKWDAETGTMEYEIRRSTPVATGFYRCDNPDKSYIVEKMRGLLTSMLTKVDSGLTNAQHEVLQAEQALKNYRASMPTEDVMSAAHRASSTKRKA